MRKIDVNKWKRKELWELFQKAEDAFVGVTVEIDVTKAYRKCKENNWSFHHYYHYLTIVVVNEMDEFKSRVVNGEPVIFDRIHMTTTLLRPDKTFSVGYVPYKQGDSFELFSQLAKKNFKEVLDAPGLGLNEESTAYDIVHCSAVPNLKFVGLMLARSFSKDDSSPKFTYGKMTEINGKLIMPLAVNVHHGFIDGYQIGEFVDRFQVLLNK